MEKSEVWENLQICQDLVVAAHILSPPTLCLSPCPFSPLPGDQCDYSVCRRVALVVNRDQITKSLL